MKDPDSAQFWDMRINYSEELGAVSRVQGNAEHELGRLKSTPALRGRRNSVILGETTSPTYGHALASGNFTN